MREIGLIGDSTYKRAWQRLASLRKAEMFLPESIARFSGEQPVMLARAMELANKNGHGADILADDLCWDVRMIGHFVGLPDERPPLRLVTNNGDSAHEDMESVRAGRYTDLAEG
jgi:hypothetical protein